MKYISRYFIIFLICLGLGSCLSVYPRYEKTPCAELKTPLENVKDLLKNSRNNLGYAEVQEKEIKLFKGKKTFVYSGIKKVYIKTKKSIFTKPYYWVMVVMKNKETFHFETRDLDLTVKSYSALECLAGI